LLQDLHRLGNRNPPRFRQVRLPPPLLLKTEG
jgi:hypothetical protein